MKTSNRPLVRYKIVVEFATDASTTELEEVAENAAAAVESLYRDLGRRVFSRSFRVEKAKNERHPY